MAIENNRVKTSLFLTFLMIMAPFAAASTVTTFSDGSSEVVIEFKDGINSENITDGGFYVPSDETITSASIDILSDPMCGIQPKIVVRQILMISIVFHSETQEPITFS